MNWLQDKCRTLTDSAVLELIRCDCDLYGGDKTYLNVKPTKKSLKKFGMRFARKPDAGNPHVRFDEG